MRAIKYTTRVILYHIVIPAAEDKKSRVQFLPLRPYNIVLKRTVFFLFSANVSYAFLRDC